MDRAGKVRQAARSVEDEAARHARLRKRRSLRTSTDADGLVVGSFRFAPKDLAPVAAELRRRRETEFTMARRQGRQEALDAYAADALLSMLTTTPTDATGGPGSPPEPISQAKARARPKPEVVVVVDGIALRSGHVGYGERCEIAGVGPVDVAWVNQLLPDAIVHALVHDGVDITTYASATRHIPAPVKLAVERRDETCVVRGCHRPRVEHDHRHDFARGGEASLDNLELLCRFHHDQKTHRGARLERHDPHWYWSPPPTDRRSRGLDHSPDPWTSPIGGHLTLWDFDTLHPDGTPDTG